MSLEKKVIIRILAETEVEKTKSAISIFKRLKKQLVSVDRSAYNLIKSWKQQKKATDNVNKANEHRIATVKKWLAKEGQVKKALKAITKANKEYKAAQDASTESTKRLISETKKLAGRAAFAGASKGASMYFGALKKGFGIAINAAKKMGIVLAGVAAGSSFAYMNLRDEVAKIKIVFDDANFSADQMLKNLMTLSEQSIFSATDLGNAMYGVAAAMGDLSTEELEEITNMASDLAMASGFDDVNTAAELLLGTFRTFGETGEGADSVITQMEKMKLVVWKAAADTSLSIQDIGVAMQFVGGTAQSMDQELSNVLAGLGMLRNANMSASVASTSLNMILTGLSAPSREAESWFRRLGVSTVDAEGNMREYTDVMYDLDKAFDDFPWRDQQQKQQVLLDMFGIRGKRAAVIFMKNMDESGNHLAELGDSFLDNTKAAEDFEKRIEDYMETPKAAFKRLTNIVTNFGVILAEAFLMEEGEDGQMVLAGWVKQIENLLASEEIKVFMKDLGEILNRMATVIIPILLKAFEVLGPIFLQVMDIVASVMEDERFQELMDAVLHLAGALGEKLVESLKRILPIFMRMLPTITKIVVLIEEFIPLIDLLTLSFEILAPFIHIGLIGIEMLMGVLAPFIPLIRDVGATLMKFLAMPLNIVVSAMSAFMTIVGAVIHAVGELTGNKEWINMGKDMKERSQEMRELSTGMMAGGGALTAGGTQWKWDTGNTYYYNFDTTIEGNADEEAMDKLSEELSEDMNRTVGRSGRW